MLVFPTYSINIAEILTDNRRKSHCINVGRSNTQNTHKEQMEKGDKCQVQRRMHAQKNLNVIKKLATLWESKNRNTLGTGKNKHRANRTKSKTRILSLQ